MAVLLMAMTPTQRHGGLPGLMPHHWGAITPTKDMIAVAPSMVTVTWNRPRPNTWRRIALSLDRLNSSPITNIRNTTPNSPR